MTRLGSSPATVCQCSHSIDDHLGHYGECLHTSQDWKSPCPCPLFELDADR